MARQLSLSVTLNDEATFDNFWVAPGNPILDFLSSWCATSHSEQDNVVFLFGQNGSGKSHLLQAACQCVSRRGGVAQYLPLSELAEMPPDAVVDSLEEASLVCLDDIDVIAGSGDWELAIFDFYNRMRESGHQLLISGSSAPASLDVRLPDLKSRLGWGAVFQLEPPDDQRRGAILRFRGAKRGIELSEDATRFLLHRSERDLTALMNLLKKLDSASLEEKRAVTVPFIKQVMGW